MSFLRGIICLLLSVKATAGIESLLAWFLLIDATHESHFRRTTVGGFLVNSPLSNSIYFLISSSACSFHVRRSWRHATMRETQGADLIKRIFKI